MKLPFATTAIMAMLVGSAAAQSPAKPGPGQSNLKPAAAAARTPVQSPADTAKAMQQTERVALQSDLAWTGVYNGVINGEVSDRMVAAIKAFQKDHGSKETGALNPQERDTLAAAARKLRDNVGWKIVSDPVTGARLGLPTKLVPVFVGDASGARWTSSTGAIEVESAHRKEAGATTASLADRERKLNGRKIEYSAVKPDFFVLSGTQGLKKFYIRGQALDDEVRVLTILYDQATEGTMTPVTVAMSSAYNPFPSTAAAQAGAPPRRKVEYSTGIVVNTDGALLAEHDSVDDCMTVAVPGYGNATRIADDEPHGLTLLRIYGTTGLKPLAITDSGAGGSTLTLTGIADPQNQGGRNAVTRVPATAATAGHETTLSPAPGLGFSGAAAIGNDGKFAGLARLKPATVASATATPVPAQATLISAEAVRDFLKTSGVAPVSGAADAKSSVLRLVCVRK